MDLGILVINIKNSFKFSYKTDLIIIINIIIKLGQIKFHLYAYNKYLVKHYNLMFIQ